MEGGGWVVDLSLPVHRSGKGNHAHTLSSPQIFVLLLLFLIDTPTHARTHIQAPSGGGISEVSPLPV